ncbi:hypothetical protein [Luteimonas granuli]|uniref:hypothetical protein n=1 Tax=Luteimonas granuli TaxID=1176533 RepID=UPI00143DEC7E|nr:hypothetical protein [Luteimonas granuli]
MDTGHGRRACIAALVVIPLAACAGPGVRDFGGRWLPANAYAATTRAVPLHEGHVFQATPMDGTLRNLLARWAGDSGSELDYRHPFDFTLHAPVAEVHARVLADAVAQLGAAFAPQGVVMRMEGSRLVVAAADGGEG